MAQKKMEDEELASSQGDSQRSWKFSASQRSGDGDASAANEALQQKRETLASFMQACGRESDRLHTCGNWDQLQSSGKSRRMRNLTKTLQDVVSVYFPNDREKVTPLAGSMLCNKVDDPQSSLPQETDSLFKAVAEAFDLSGTAQERRQVLSIAAMAAPYSLVQKYIPDLGLKAYTNARHYGKREGIGKPPPKEIPRRQKYNPVAVTDFISYIVEQSTDLPFGERTLKLGSGKDVVVPNMVRNVQAEQLVENYLGTCVEREPAITFEPLSRSSLLKILKNCKASYRKCLQGLDNYVYFGGKGFDTLDHVVRQIGAATGNTAWMNQQQKALRLSKVYLKTDFKAHVALTSNTADHCTQFALSDPKHPNLQIACDHKHTAGCPR